MQYHANLRHPKRLIQSLKYDNVRDVWVEVAHSLTASQLVLGRGGGSLPPFYQSPGPSNHGEISDRAKIRVIFSPTVR